MSQAAEEALAAASAADSEAAAKLGALQTQLGITPAARPSAAGAAAADAGDAAGEADAAAAAEPVAPQVQLGYSDEKRLNELKQQAEAAVALLAEAQQAADVAGGCLRKGARMRYEVLTEHCKCIGLLQPQQRAVTCKAEDLTSGSADDARTPCYDPIQQKHLACSCRTDHSALPCPPIHHPSQLLQWQPPKAP